MTLGEHAAIVRALFPVVAGGKIALLVLGEMLVVTLLLAAALAGGGSPSSALKLCVIHPAMILVALATAHTVSALRTTGELELAVTLASPARFLLHRVAPVVVLASAQMVVAGLALMLILAPWQVLVAWLCGVLPLALATAASLYWNLRCRGTGAVLLASLATVIPAVIWIENAELFVESENMISMTPYDVVMSALRCQLGLLLATLVLLALTRRRLLRTEELLDA